MYYPERPIILGEVVFCRRFLKQSKAFYVEKKRDCKSFKRSDHLNNCVNRERNAFILGWKVVSLIDVI